MGGSQPDRRCPFASQASQLVAPAASSSCWLLHHAAAAQFAKFGWADVCSLYWRGLELCLGRQQLLLGGNFSGISDARAYARCCPGARGHMYISYVLKYGVRYR
jgi:hypothetical protein